MANPQPDQFIRISTEIMDKLISFRIPGELRQVFDLIIRKTWGFGKKEDYIALSQFVEATGQKKSNVVRSLSKLITHNLVIKTDNERGSKFTIQKDFDKWIPLSKLITSVIKTDNETLSEVIPTIDKIDNITKDITSAKSQKHQKIGEVVTKKRKDVVYPKAIIQDIVAYYVQKKGITPQGNEWLPLLQRAKSMLMNGRNPDDIKEFISWLSENWATWSLDTGSNRLPEFLAGKLDKERNKINPIVNDPIFKKLLEFKGRDVIGAEFKFKDSLIDKLNEKYPTFRYENYWGEARQMLHSKDAGNNRIN